MSQSAPSPLLTRQISVDHVSDVHVAARTAREVAHDVGLPGALPDKAAVIASELASNLDKHAHHGAVYIQPLLTETGVEVLAVDRGPGMAHLELCLTDGHTTTGTLGVGLGAIRRMAAELLIHTELGAGTVASARITPTAPTAAGLRLGRLCLPAAGEDASGDAIAVAVDGDTTTLLVVDALGHGPDAAWIADLATRIFHRDAHRPLATLFTDLHRTLRHTRGAVAAALRLAPGRAEFCGVGNITTAIIGRGGLRRVLSQPGIVGLRSLAFTSRTIDLDPADTVVLHTDGIEERWIVNSVHVPRLPPPLLAAHLLHHHRAPRDDAALLAVQAPWGRP